MPSVGFKPVIPVSERPWTHALDGAATGMGLKNNLPTENISKI